LLTVRAVRLIEASPVCIYAGTYLDDQILAYCPPDATLIDSQHLDLDQITDHLVALAGVGPMWRDSAPVIRRSTRHLPSKPGASTRQG
jgi:precorrin-4 methylase